MKKIILEKYKLVNICFLLLVLLLLVFMHINFENWFKDTNDIYYIYKYYDGIYAPVFSGGKWLAGILGVLLFFPSRFFRKWLFFIAPVILLLTYYLVQGISVYSGNLLNPTRAKMAENGMLLLASITAVFVIGHLIYDKRKKRK
jgi:hypothetical protein